MCVGSGSDSLKILFEKPWTVLGTLNGTLNGRLELKPVWTQARECGASKDEKIDEICSGGKPVDFPPAKRTQTPLRIDDVLGGFSRTADGGDRRQVDRSRCICQCVL